MYRPRFSLGSVNSHVSDIDDLLVAEASRPEVYALLFSKLEVLAAALTRQERGEEILHKADLLVLQV